MIPVSATGSHGLRPMSPSMSRALLSASNQTSCVGSARDGWASSGMHAGRSQGSGHAAMRGDCAPTLIRLCSRNLTVALDQVLTFDEHGATGQDNSVACHFVVKAYMSQSTSDALQAARDGVARSGDWEMPEIWLLVRGSAGAGVPGL